MRTRAGLCVVFCAVVLLVPTAASAALSSLTVAVPQVTAGSTVQVSGARFSATPGASNIELRLGQRSGPVIGSIAPATNFTATIVIPAATSVGDHLLVATQYAVGGNPVPGTPGRTRFRVVPASASAGSSAASDQPWVPGRAGGWLLAIGLSLALGAASLRLRGRDTAEATTDALRCARRA